MEFTISVGLNRNQNKCSHFLKQCLKVEIIIPHQTEDSWLENATPEVPRQMNITKDIYLGGKNPCKQRVK